MRTLAALVIAGLLLPVSVGARQSPQPPSRDARAGEPRYTVTLDASATDARGRAVETLTAKDFELTVDGTPQPLDSVSAVPEGADAPQGAGRLFAIFLDEFHTSADAAAAFAPALARFIDEQVHPEDRVIVMKPLDSLFAIAPERDRAAVREAVGKFEGRKGLYEPRNSFEQNFMGRSPDAVARLRRQVTVSALNALAVRLGSLRSGRKALLVVSEGFQPSAHLRGEEALPTTDTIVKNANRHNVAIYGVDPAQGDGSAAESDVAVLRALASGTDGQAGSGDAAVGVMQRMVADSSRYYLLTWSPQMPADGRFHAVQLRAKRAGIRVRTRAGVWLLAPEEPLRSAEASAKAASPFESTPRHVSPLIDAWFGMARGADGRTRVTFVWEPNVRAASARPRQASRPSAIAVKAFTLEGTNLFDGSVRRAGVMAETDAGAKAVFDAPPGRVHLQMSITGDDGRELDLDTRDIAVRDLRQTVALATPEILRARSALEFRTIAADLDAAPVASRTFSRAERLLVRFAAYAPDGHVAAVTARLVNRIGQTLRTFDAATVEGDGNVRQVDLPLNGFAPGDYVLELGVSAPAGSAKELVNFRVTG